MKEQFIRFFQKRYVSGAVLACLLAVCVAAVYNGNKNNGNNDQYMVMKENESQIQKETQADNSDAKQAGADVEKSTEDENSASTENKSASEDTNENETSLKESSETAETTLSAKESEAAQAAALIDAAGLTFTSNSQLFWPVEGEIIKEYSTDKTVYFPTLHEYKCNPAMLIQGEEGTQVMIPANAVVTDVGKNEEIGNYVTMALSSEYELTLGELTAIQVEKGDTVKAGDIVGNIAAPSSYYELEGSHLYMQMMHDGVSVDPLDYLDYDE